MRHYTAAICTLQWTIIIVPSSLAICDATFFRYYGTILSQIKESINS